MAELSYSRRADEDREPAQRRRVWETELRLAALLIGFGFLVLPLAVYVVGQQVFGEYGSGGSWWDLISAIWGDLASGSAAAWVLVLSPYVVIQLFRLGAAVWRRRL